VHNTEETTMTPQTQKTSWISDDETDGSTSDGEKQSEAEQVKTQRRLAWQDRLRRGIRYIIHMNPRGNTMTNIGTHCIMVVEDARQDLGQMAQVSDRKAKMVEIIYRGAHNRQMDHKMKRPSSQCDRMETVQCGSVGKQKKTRTKLAHKDSNGLIRLF
jgi:hypothetical protein